MRLVSRGVLQSDFVRKSPCIGFVNLTIAALLFSLSALSTNPNQGGGSSGETGGSVAPWRQPNLVILMF